MRPRKVILCVDDEEQELSVLKYVLETNGYRIFTAMSGAQAVGVFIANPVDLVLVDFNMPDMDGIETIRQLKAIGNHIPMILLGDPVKLADMLSYADALLSKKGLTAIELLDSIKVMSARKRGPRKGTRSPMKTVSVAALPPTAGKLA